MTRDAVAESVEEESSSRNFIVGVILFLALRAIVRQWSQTPPDLLRTESGGANSLTLDELILERGYRYCVGCGRQGRRPLWSGQVGRFHPRSAGSSRMSRIARAQNTR